MMTNLDKFLKLLFDFKHIPKNKPGRTFLEISGFPHYENVCSNILSFFLQPANEHGFDTLMLNAFLQLCDLSKEENSGSITIEREVYTHNEKRLDLLIQTEKYVIGIENKVFHHLNNDLNSYAKTIADRCNGYNRKPVGIVLSLKKLSEEEKRKAAADKFTCITYDEFFRILKLNLGNHVLTHHPTYFIYLTDFIKSISNLKYTTMENKELWSFFKNNAGVVQELNESFELYKKTIYDKILIFKQNFPKQENAPLAQSQWIWDERKRGETDIALVHDYLIKDKYRIAVDASIGLNGWRIELFGRNLESRSYLFNTMLNNESFLPKPISDYEVGERLIFQRFDVFENLEEIMDSLRDLLARIEMHINSLKPDSVALQQVP